jgi:hypothetical protein
MRAGERVPTAYTGALVKGRKIIALGNLPSDAWRDRAHAYLQRPLHRADWLIDAAFSKGDLLVTNSILHTCTEKFSKDRFQLLAPRARLGRRCGSVMSVKMAKLMSSRSGACRLKFF